MSMLRASVDTLFPVRSSPPLPLLPRIARADERPGLGAVVGLWVARVTFARGCLQAGT